ncbi:AAA family ATPase [Phenylobacterium sp.]|uniref:nucleotide-binding protein n=1 Tax=Phenylobacterium sp. TaxID=1871053 RepID=UPI0025F3023A|nr:AAA family ATPase [Phenylobacterium sp.]MBX3482679.1 AAA family ATPase [Phenylobacterium sp.]
MPNIAFISPKGGAGKTTAALLLALGLAERGRRVALIDSDPNKPLVRWAGLPGRPERLSVHAAPTVPDIREAAAEARRLGPEWTIVDTEGSVRGAMVFAALRFDAVITPLTGSAMDAVEAIKASELVASFGKRQGNHLPHACLMSRVPAALKPRSLGAVVAQLRAREIDILPTPLIEKEAFRALFEVGGGLGGLERLGLRGVAAARANVAAYVDAVTAMIAPAQALRRAG